MKHKCDTMRGNIENLNYKLQKLEDKCGHKNTKSEYVNTDSPGVSFYFDFTKHECLDCGKVWTTPN